MSLPFKEISESALDAMIANERKQVVAPLTEWRALSQQLREEGLLRSSENNTTQGRSAEFADRGYSASASTPTVYRRGAQYWGSRVIAAVLLLGIGVFAGRATSGSNDHLQTAQVADESSSQAELVMEDFASPDDALRVLNRAQAEYQNAVAYLAVRNETEMSRPDLSNLRERLAALDAVVSAAQSAAQGAPDDPILNQYYVSSSGVRRATLQMINQSLPSGTRLAGF